jgi:hypothetical protein
MFFQRLAAIGLISMLASCAANFRSHLDVAMEEGAVTELGKTKFFKIISTDLSSQKIKYQYEKMFVFSEYTKNRETIKDSPTASLIAQRLQSIGMAESKSGDASNILILNYEEVMGWDLGEIVGKMRICGQIQSEEASPVECAEFNEMKFFNTHPTRTVITNNLLSILFTRQWPKAADKKKYSKYLLQADARGVRTEP